MTISLNNNNINYINAKIEKLLILRQQAKENEQSTINYWLDYLYNKKYEILKNGGKYVKNIF